MMVVERVGRLQAQRPRIHGDRRILGQHTAQGFEQPGRLGWVRHVRVGVALGEVGLTLGLEPADPRIGGGAALNAGYGVGQLLRCGRCIGPDAQRDREEAANGGRLKLDLDDLRVAVDVVVAVEGRVEAQPRPQREDDVRFLHQSRGNGIAARPHLTRVQRVGKGDAVAMAGRADQRTVQRLSQCNRLVMAQGVLDPAAGDDHGLTRPGEQGGGLGDGVGVRAG